MKKLYFLFILTFAISVNAQQELVITGVYDGGLSGGTPKGVELQALVDIADLSIYGIGSANNGGGSDGQEFTFSGSASAGDYIYVASESPQFTVFFGFAPTFTSGSMGINGDDAIELFKNGTVIDTFGDIDTDGTGQPWEYLDGWVYRNDNTGPDGANFTIANWTFSGVNVYDGVANNAAASPAMPVGTYKNSTLSNTNFNVIDFSIYPNPTNTGLVTISSANNSAIAVQGFDVLGKQVVSTVITNNTIDISNLKAGIYILKITQEDKSITKKVVKN